MRSRLRSLARHGQPAAWDEDDDEDDGWYEDGEEDELTARTGAVLRVALEELSEQIWQDVADVGDAPAGRGEGRVLGSLPPITFHQDQQWRRQMARRFDDLAAELRQMTGTAPPAVHRRGVWPLHLGIDRAKSLTRNRPAPGRGKRRRVSGESRRDFDWAWCSTVLFEDHGALMLFDASLQTGSRTAATTSTRPSGSPTWPLRTGSCLCPPSPGPRPRPRLPPLLTPGPPPGPGLQRVSMKAAD
ncbi:hypothetical protein [Streptomyces sp. NL15-2K]|uniref:hypothetical protein n=1 Tax=Streptomyces sp. NL15-2K TaxID=376149 RepID=UPI0026F0A126|nr:hypothetical protein [Kutzneria buriramensis]WKX05967.1 hypothetical protein Q4V64_00035 [Kutzneria buriramensis]